VLAPVLTPPTAQLPLAPAVLLPLLTELVALQPGLDLAVVDGGVRMPAPAPVAAPAAVAGPAPVAAPAKPAPLPVYAPRQDRN
jgi:hypothetical protein